MPLHDRLGIFIAVVVFLIVLSRAYKIETKETKDYPLFNFVVSSIVALILAIVAFGLIQLISWTILG